MKLLKTAAFVLFFSLMFNSANAQGWGVRAGANFSSLSGNNDTQTQTGLYAGLYKQYRIIPKLLFIQPELQYSAQGFSTKENNYEMHFINVPVLARLYFLKLLSIETGPQFGLLVNDSTDATNNPDYNSFSTAWDFGLTLELPFGLSFDGRYISNFNDTVKNSNGKGQIFQVGAGFKF